MAATGRALRPRGPSGGADSRKAPENPCPTLRKRGGASDEVGADRSGLQKLGKRSETRASTGAGPGPRFHRTPLVRPVRGGFQRDANDPRGADYATVDSTSMRSAFRSSNRSSGRSSCPPATSVAMDSRTGITSPFCSGVRLTGSDRADVLERLARRLHRVHLRKQRLAGVRGDDDPGRRRSTGS